MVWNRFGKRIGSGYDYTSRIIILVWIDNKEHTLGEYTKGI